MNLEVDLGVVNVNAVERYEQQTRDHVSFDTPAGTRGSRPAGPFGRWLDKQAGKLGGTRIGRKVFRKLMGCDALVLTTIGRKSGTERTHRIGCFPGKDGSWLIVASAGGTAVNPAWYYNMAAHPDKVQIGIEGRTVAVTAEQLHGAERAAAWQQITATSPQFARFQQRTDRELPVIRLMPRSGSKAPQP
jgi:deazaflavin-dependent oxidoreductase (nitroreductase family)